MPFAEVAAGITGEESLSHIEKSEGYPKSARPSYGGPGGNHGWTRNRCALPESRVVKISADLLAVEPLPISIAIAKTF